MEQWKIGKLENWNIGILNDGFQPAGWQGWIDGMRKWVHRKMKY